MRLPRNPTHEGGPSTRGLLLGYSGSLAFVAGCVNAVALLVLAFPVGNLTGVTTQLGMNTANPWLYEGHLLAAILLGFWGGAMTAGVILGTNQHPTQATHAAMLTMEAALLVLAALGENAEAQGYIAGLGIEPPVVQALFAAAALGLQNGLTSSFRGMAIRTTHFTGTVTDLGLMLGRSRRQGIDKWKLAVLSVTLLLFLVGGATGLLFGNWLSGYAFVAPAAICLIMAGSYSVPSRRLVAASEDTRATQPAGEKAPASV
ncbi:YoaK family protein [Mycobacterium angelicum]|uniref:YoaK family protein n=1 Tax=Mycobacterium angelicum TaxID=470074 RepID=UPI001FE91882|nr:YoaK family protein [Mycobacterium angelicum]